MHRRGPRTKMDPTLLRAWSAGVPHYKNPACRNLYAYCSAHLTLPHHNFSASEARVDSQDALGPPMAELCTQSAHMVM